MVSMADRSDAFESPAPDSTALPEALDFNLTKPAPVLR